MKRPFRRAVFAAALVAGALALSGCASSSASAESALDGAQAQSSRLTVRSAPATNSGNVLYMMVRRLDAKAAVLAQSYEETAALLSAPGEDDTVLAVRPIFPGRPATLTVQSAEDDHVFAYFFFTSPGPNWRVGLPTPLPKAVSLELGVDQVERVEADP